MIKQKELYLLAALAVIPLVLWRSWMARFPEGIPAYHWLLNQDQIRFKGAFFYWLFAKRWGELILGFWGLIPLGLGLVLRPGKKEGWFFHFWFLTIFVYLSVFATGNVRHDYYQIITVPILAIFLGKGFRFLISREARKLIHPWLGRGLAGLSLAFALAVPPVATRSPTIKILSPLFTASVCICKIFFPYSSSYEASVVS